MTPVLPEGDGVPPVLPEGEGVEPDEPVEPEPELPKVVALGALADGMLIVVL